MTDTVLRHNFSRKPFVCVINDVARDGRLSYGARGLLVDMLSRPSNWAFSADRLAANSPSEGRKTILRFQRELESAGYLLRVRERDERGRLRTVVTVSDEPVDDWIRDVPAGRTESPSRNAGGRNAGGRAAYRKKETKERNEGSDPSDRGAVPSPVPTSRADGASAPSSRRRKSSSDKEPCCQLAANIEANEGRWKHATARYYAEGEEDSEVFDAFMDVLGDLDDATRRVVDGQLADGRHLKAVAWQAHLLECGPR